MNSWVILIFITFSLIFKCNTGLEVQENESTNNNALRKRVTDEVLKKIKKISSEAVSNISSNERGDIMRSIENKLKIAAEPLGKRGEKYIRLIMRGLRTDSSSKNLRSNPEDKLEEIQSNDGQNNSISDSPRDTMINFMMEKINKFTLELNNATSNDEQAKILKSVGEKFKKASKSFGKKANKYFNIVMNSIRKNIKKIKPKDAKSFSNDVRRYGEAQKDDESKNSRNVMIDKILKKINKIAETEIDDDQMPKKRAIEKQLRAAAQPLGNKGLKYVNLILKALRANDKNMRSTTLDDTSEEINQVVKDALKFHTMLKENKGNSEIRKQAVENVAMAISDIINKNISYQHHNYVIEKVKNVTFEHMIVNDLFKDKKEVKLLSDFIASAINEANMKFVLKTTTPQISIGSIIKNNQQLKMNRQSDPLCKNTIKVTCTNIKKMNSLKCAYVEEHISFFELCDGKYDCADRSDEKNCAQQAVEKIRYAQKVLSDLDKSLESNCLVNDINEKVLSKQNLILRDVLKAQLNFIEKYKDENVVITNKGTPDETVTPPVREITEVIGTLTIALDKALCTRPDLEDDPNLRRFNEIFEENIEVTQAPSTAVWSPKACQCTYEHCINCTRECKRICWQKSSLSNWNCDSVNDTSMVPLNVLCDGKYDCFDQSDERDCFTDNIHGKFESHKIFSEIIESLKLKAAKDLKGVRNILWVLINTVTDLEKLSLQPNPHPNTIKDNRDKIYQLLGELYTEIVKHFFPAYRMEEAEEAYMFLLSINQQLGAILKRIGTGNKKIISDNCFCIKGKCAATYCTRRCEKACLVKPKLTQYFCDNNNKTIGFENICDGKPDCPLEDDEKDCSKDVCRTHHITVLRLKVQDFGIKQKGTAMGEVISTWKTKVLANLKVAEKAGRPTRKVLIELVKDILKDLVLTYGAVEDYRRRDNNYALEHFTNIAKNVIDTLRSCGK